MKKIILFGIVIANFVFVGCDKHKEKVPFVGEVFDIVKLKEIYSLLICSDLKLQSVEKLGKYMHKIGWKDSNAYVFEGMADTLIEAICTIGYRKEFYRAIIDYQHRERRFGKTSEQIR